jgi:hypothetical protein
MYELRIRPRAISELRQVLLDYTRLDHERSFLTELDLVFESYA